MTAATATSTYTPRQMRALPGGSHDRLITVLRWLLPALALALLALIIIWPLTNAREFSFLLVKDKVAMSPDRLRIDNALYRGETADGQPFEIRALDAVQRSSAVPVVVLRDLSAELGTSDGPVRVSAPSGLYDMDKDLLTVAGPVRVASTAGFGLESGVVRISLLDRTIASDEPIRGHLPLGRFSADSMRGDIDGRVIMLDGNVRMHVTPGQRLRATPGGAMPDGSLHNSATTRK